MNRDVIYVYENGEWMYSVDWNLADHEHLGKYQEFVIGMGFQDFEVNEMVNQYLTALWYEED